MAMSDDIVSEALYDERLLKPYSLPDLLPEATKGAFADGKVLAAAQDRWRAELADTLYGRIPAAPGHVEVKRQRLEGESAELLSIKMVSGPKLLEQKAALWLPKSRSGRVPLILGLDFLGPAGILFSESYPLDEDAIIGPRPVVGVLDGHLNPVVRGATGYRWPIEMFLNAGYAVMVSCYGSWVPDDPAAWRTRGVFPFTDDDQRAETRAFSLWAWSIMRMIDAAQLLPEIDDGNITVAGHSRLGKTALWAAANDERISAVFASCSGCAGAGLMRHAIGETLTLMERRFPQWTLPGSAQLDWEALGIDQHQLLACIAPRLVYLSGATDDLWSNPKGCYQGLRAAAPAWMVDSSLLPEADSTWAPSSVHAGPLGWHLRVGGHEMLPYDWQLFLKFLSDRQAS